jgi:hypothetical protein
MQGNLEVIQFMCSKCASSVFAALPPAKFPKGHRSLATQKDNYGPAGRNTGNPTYHDQLHDQ